MGGIALVAGLAGGACWLLVVHGCGLKLPMCNNIYLLNCIAFTMINLSYIIHLKVMVFVSLSLVQVPPESPSLFPQLHGPWPRLLLQLSVQMHPLQLHHHKMRVALTKPSGIGQGLSYG